MCVSRSAVCSEGVDNPHVTSTIHLHILDRTVRDTIARSECLIHGLVLIRIIDKIRIGLFATLQLNSTYIHTKHRKVFSVLK